MNDEPDALAPVAEHLFAAGRGERPSNTARARALEQAMASARSAARRRFAGVVAAIAVAAGVACIVAYEGAAEDPAAIDAEPPLARALAPEPELPASAESPALAPSVAIPGDPRDAYPRGRVGSPPALTLADELALLQRARAAIAAGDAERALVELDRHRRGATGAQLGDEATLLRIEALIRAGRGDEAAALARAFARDNPGSPLVDRARSLAESLGPSVECRPVP